ncbi:mRNA cap guanine-N7 methyltransferase [Fasciola hepatica]|uniref:mRNA (guanine-N(7))-methyltransferase n=1 Tax=Fasciola hepatica TaxID=6192 RepID=A0A4E0R5V8_FASHE|nr:mRNA cap guanine-N7 methyltransferase [Fasciola hepatica]
MGDVSELLSKGRRNLACVEIPQAVENFQKACELLATEFGDLDERLADPNLLYGTALLELARMESTVIGNALEGVPEDDDSSETEVECDVVETGPEMTGKLCEISNLLAEEKEELSNQVIDAMCEEEKALPSDSVDNGKGSPTTQSEEIAAQEETANKDVVNEEMEETSEESKVKTDFKESEEESEEADKATNALVEEENSDVDGEQDENKEVEAEDVTNLQLAWEVIEVSRKIFSRKDDDGSRLKVAECYEKLGEISREKEDYEQAVSDLQECLNLRQSILPEDSREVAETHFQIGTTHAVAGNLEFATSAFEAAIKTLRKHAETLSASIAKEDSHSEGELELLRSSLREVESLIPEVEKRKAEVVEDLQMSRMHPGTSQSAPLPVTNGDQKPAGDISHLIRKKRRVSDTAVEVCEDSTEADGDDSSPNTKKMKVTVAVDAEIPNGAHQSESELEVRRVPSDSATANNSGRVTTESANAANVVKFYDSAARSVTANSLAHREQTRIFHLRNFNNWIKSVFINQYVEKLGHSPGIHVLDLCCGKGGDQLKWAQSNVRHVTFIDISSASIDTCRQRYDQLYRKRQRSLFTADFHVADCTADLRKTILIRRNRYDLVSCQFSFHYAFESLTQSRTFLANVNHCLRPGGYFIATIPNAYEVVRRAKKAYREIHQSVTINKDSVEEIQFGNSVYSIRFPISSYSVKPNDDRGTQSCSLSFPLFGSRYDFTLEGVVDCPEFLVYPPLLNTLASEQNLIPVAAPVSFAEFFSRYHSGYIGRMSSRDLLLRMKALETYPNQVHGEKLCSMLVANGEPGAYDHVHQKMEHDDACAQSRYLGTLSLAEWEAITLYSLVGFRKM